MYCSIHIVVVDFLDYKRHISGRLETKDNIYVHVDLAVLQITSVGKMSTQRDRNRRWFVQRQYVIRNPVFNIEHGDARAHNGVLMRHR